MFTDIKMKGPLSIDFSPESSLTFTSVIFVTVGAGGGFSAFFGPVTDPEVMEIYSSSVQSAYLLSVISFLFTLAYSSKARKLEEKFGRRRSSGGLLYALRDSCR